MQGKEINRKYFNKLFRTFLSISVIPLIICTAAVLIMMNRVTVSQYKQKTNDILTAGNNKLGSLITECSHIAESLSNNVDIKDDLKNNYSLGNGEIDKNIRFLMTGRQEKFQITVLDADRNEAYCTDTLSRLYDLSVYSDWGIFRKIRNDPNMTVVYPTSFYNNQGKKSVMIIGRAIIGINNTVLGYVLIDVYRDTLLDIFSQDDNQYAKFILLGDDDIVILDTISDEDEGKVLQSSDSSEVWLDKYSVIKRGNIEDFVSGQKSVIDNTDLLSNLSLFTFVPAIGFQQTKNNTTVIAMLLIFLTGTLCLIAASYMTKQLYHPVEVLVNAMNEVELGRLNAHVDIDPSKTDEVTAVGKCFNRMINQIQELLQDVVEQTKRQASAEMKALQAQISPHFLYNMLNEIKALAKMGRNQEVSKFAVQLGKLLRASYTYKGAYTTIGEDIELIKSYLELQKIRYEGSFEYTVNIMSEVLPCRLPKLILQPIVENSILHGLTGGAGIISINCCLKGNDVRIEISDNGAGVKEDIVSRINSCQSSDNTIYNGLGLLNVQRRIQIEYGDPYGIYIESKMKSSDTEGYSRIIITIPFNIEKEEV